MVVKATQKGGRVMILNRVGVRGFMEKGASP